MKMEMKNENGGNIFHHFLEFIFFMIGWRGLGYSVFVTLLLPLLSEEKRPCGGLEGAEPLQGGTVSMVTA
jgi:hypothetical protein